MYIEFEASGQDLSRTDHAKLAAESRNYLKARFQFSEEYAGLTKTAVFTAPKTEEAEAVSDSRVLTDDVCDVPAGIIRPPYFEVSVVAGDRITTDIVPVPVDPSAATLGAYPPEVSQERYDELIAQFDTKLAAAAGEADRASARADIAAAKAEETITAAGTLKTYADAKKTELEGIARTAQESLETAGERALVEMETAKQELLVQAGEIFLDMGAERAGMKDEIDGALAGMAEIQADVTQKRDEACAAADRAEQAGGGGLNSGAFLELLEAVGLRGASVFPVLDGWEFSKANAAETETVSLPHTCNAADGQSAAMYFGETVYERNISLAKQDLRGNLYLLVEYAGQKCDVYVNGNLAASHAGGYTPFVVRLNPYAVPDSNRLRIVCGNTLDFDIIPVSGDFNRCNGLYGGVYIAKCGAISFTPDGYGPGRIKLTQVSAGAERADLRIQGHILGVRGAETECGLAVTVSGPDGEKVRETVRCTVPPEGLDFDRTVSVLSPVLWQGVENPHLYTAAVSIEQSGA